MKQAVLALAFIGALWMGGYEFGWLMPRASWEKATGWSQIPEDQKGLGSISTKVFPDSPDEASIQWLGHSGFLIEWKGLRILLDPNLSQRCSVSDRFIAPPTGLSGTSVDLVCISHAHYDHLDPEALQTLKSLGHILLPDGSDVFLPETLPGNPQRVGLKAWESFQVGDITVTAVPAKHNGHRHHPWKSPYLALGYVLSDGQKSLYFAGDTARQSDVDTAIRTRLSPDVSILPIGAYAPRFPLKIHHISPEEAVASGKDLGVAKIIPCHFGTFRLSLDRPSTALPRFIQEANQQAIAWTLTPPYTTTEPEH